MPVLDSREGMPAADGGHRLMPETVLAGSVGADLAVGRGPAWLDSWLAANTSDLVSWRRRIHADPELSRHEYRTTEFVSGLLRSIGCRPRVLPTGTGLICDIGDASEGPCVALRADVDALALTEHSGLPYSSTTEGAAHACGHDVHTVALLGAAYALANAPRLPGRVRLIFQPAEEMIPGGALDVIAAGELEGVDRIFGLHCSPQIAVGKVGVCDGAVTSATDILTLRFDSPGGHTSRPHLTADLVHAIGTVATGLPAMLSRRVDPRSATVLAWGAVHAGDAPNAVPMVGELRGTLRTADGAVWQQLEPLVAGIVPALVEPTGVHVTLRHDRGMPPAVNDEVSTALFRSAVDAALGEDALVDTGQSSGGDDFAWYLEQVPGVYARLGVWSGDGPQHDIHHPGFVADERALAVGVRVLVNAAVAALGR